MPTDQRTKLALRLFEIGAIKFGAFRLKLHEKHPEAPLSPIYVDLRILRSFPDVMELAVDLYTKLSAPLSFDLLADVPTAATPIVAILSNKTRVPMISPRKEEKAHGLIRSIDGVFTTGQVALLVDDLITLAESKLETIAVLEENGVRVHDVVVLLDRQQGGAQVLSQKGYRCHAGFQLADLLEVYLAAGKISREQYVHTTSYLGINSALGGSAASIGV